MRYGGVERVVEGVKRRRVMGEESSSAAAAAAAAAATSSQIVDRVPDKDCGDASVFDLEILDCTICTEPLASPIYQCENGHIACASCSKLTKHVCPSCKKPTGSIRCLALEKLIESLKVKCKFAVVGCTEMVKFSDKGYHERICSFAPLSCPFPECNNFQGKYELLQEHVKYTHPEDWDVLLHQAAVIFVMGPTDRFHLLFDNGICFVVNRRKSSVGDMCYLTLAKVLSTRYGMETSFHYRMEIKTLSDGDGAVSSTFTVDAQCCIDASKATPRDGFIVVPEDRLVEISVMFLPRSRRPDKW
ncbi:hypothetical protein M758_8G193300 [Ceratodon purpureus]|nr:hypothetical protein M758_8G193300 [Ceratodon purpureus]